MVDWYTFRSFPWLPTCVWFALATLTKSTIKKLITLLLGTIVKTMWLHWNEVGMMYSWWDHEQWNSWELTYLSTHNYDKNMFFHPSAQLKKHHLCHSNASEGWIYSTCYRRSPQLLAIPINIITGIIFNMVFLFWSILGHILAIPIKVIL